MANNMDELVGEIRGLARGRLSEIRTAELIHEVRSHVEAGIQAGISEGLSAGNAENQAIQSFGDPGVVIKDLAELHTGNRVGFDRSVALAFAVSISVIIAFAYFVMEFPYAGAWSLVLFIAIWIAAAVWIGMASWQARKVQILPAVAATILGAVLFAGIQCFTWSADGRSYLSQGSKTSEAAADYKQTFQDFTALRKSEQTFNEQNSKFLASLASGAKVFQEPQLEIHGRAYRFDTTPRAALESLGDRMQGFVFRPAHSKEEAVRAWTKAIPMALNAASNETARITSNISFDTEKLERPLWMNFLLLLPGGIFGSAAIMGLLASVHLATVLARFLTSLKTRRRLLA